MAEPASYWTSSWWGGRLADGTYIVTNPAIKVQAILDRTATASTATHTYQPPSDGTVRGWLSHRVDGIGPWRFPLAPMRLSLVLASLAVLVPVALFIVLRPPAGTAVLFGLGALVLVLAVVRLVEWRHVDPRDGQVVAETDRGPLAPLRYVHDAVASHPAWAVLAGCADQFTSGTEQRAQTHQMLWQAAAVEPYLDTGLLDPADNAALAQWGDAARDLTGASASWPARPDETGPPAL